MNAEEKQKKINEAKAIMADIIRDTLLKINGRTHSLGKFDLFDREERGRIYESLDQAMDLLIEALEQK